MGEIGEVGEIVCVKWAKRVKSACEIVNLGEIA
jgi:hypothetical protein